MLDISFYILVPIFVGFFAGYYLDKYLGFKYPVMTISLTILGIFTGMWSVFKRYMK